MARIGAFSTSETAPDMSIKSIPNEAISWRILPVMAFPMEFSGPGSWPRESAVKLRNRVRGRRAIDIPIGQLVPHTAILDGQTVFQLDFLGQLKRLFKSRRRPFADRKPFIHQRREGDPPTIADLAKPLAIRHTHIGEEHFVEIRRAGDLMNRPAFDPRRFHIKEEIGEAFVLRHGGIAACHDDAVIAKMRAGCPNLLAVQDPIVAVAFRAQTQVR